MNQMYFNSMTSGEVKFFQSIKKSISFFIAIASLLIFANCGGSSGGNSNPTNTGGGSQTNNPSGSSSSFDQAYMVSAGGHHTCATSLNQNFICWGSNEYGQLGGHFDEEYVGDDEVPSDLGLVPVQEYNIFDTVETGQRHTCVLDIDGRVGCIGSDTNGRLGHGPSGANPVRVGKTVTQLSLGDEHTCALTSDGKIRCWGDNGFGRLGYGNTFDIGDDEYPEDAGDVKLGDLTFTQVSAGNHHTCALSSDNDIYCWGQGIDGALGYGNNEHIGDDETPYSAGPVLSNAKAIDVGGNTSCALSFGGEVLCWGSGASGRLGNGYTGDIGDDEFIDTEATVVLSGEAKQISVGQSSACAVLVDGNVQCWGSNKYGQLGYSFVEEVGTAEVLPIDVGYVNLGGKAKEVSVGRFHACAVMESNSIRCWGKGEEGQLGYGIPQNIGDVFDPAEYYSDILNSNGDVSL
ncbi:MAG: hypothetical protein H7A32_02220 [Deltaproteobacteria bacterium]|nr:hypothetical protein [Deltaproteobacteria bacterium]